MFKVTYEFITPVIETLEWICGDTESVRRLVAWIRADFKRLKKFGKSSALLVIEGGHSYFVLKGTDLVVAKHPDNYEKLQ